MKNFKNVTIKEVSKLICDCCGEQATPSDSTFHEYISINQRCGYGSIHGDGNQLSIDLCQNCFANMCGDNLTVIELNNEIHEDIELKQIVEERESQSEIEVDIDDL